MNSYQILEQLGITEEQAVTLFKHIMEIVEEESYQASQKMFEDVAKRCGYDSYTDYLRSQQDCPGETLAE